jgi:hypothetical protein
VQARPGRLTGARRRAAIGLLTAVCVLAAALGFAFRDTVRHQLALSFTRQPTPYTELYFDPMDQVVEAQNGTFPSPISFVITNHEGAATRYSYTAVLTGSSGPFGSGQGDVTLPAGSSAHIQVTLDHAGYTGSYLVTISLADKPQSISLHGVLR